MLVFNSAYEQNQDSIAGVEYSVDGGATWLPVIYMLDDQGGTADIIRTNGVIDVWATFGTARADQAFGLAVANGRLFISTDTGYIYSFAQNQTSRQSSWMLF